MYTLRVDNQLLYKDGIGELQMVSNPQIELELNKSGTLDFDIQSGHPMYDKIEKLTTYIDLYDEETWLWRFRVVNEKEDFYKIKTVECEGILSFFVDSIQRPFEFTGGIKKFLEQMVKVHNSQVEKEKQFTVGLVSVTDSNDYINRSSGNYNNTLSMLNEKLVKTHGGYLRVRRENQINYLDYLSDYNKISEQSIVFGENLQDLEHYIQGDNVITAIIPLGADLEEEGINGVKKRTTIESVNDGKDYLIHEAGSKIFGLIWDTVTFDDVTIPTNLKKKAEAYLEESINFDYSLEISAIDMKYIDKNLPFIMLGSWIRVKSPPHNLDTQMLVSKLNINLGNPESDIFILGSVLDNFTTTVTNKNKEVTIKIEEVAKSSADFINEMVEHQTNIITGGYGGYMFINVNEDGQANELYFMDTPDKKTAKTVLRINKNGIGFSLNGLNGSYNTAWTLDGSFNANYITAGTIKGIRLEGITIDGGNINVKSDLYVGKKIIMQHGTPGEFTRIQLNQNTYVHSSYYQIAMLNDSNGSCGIRITDNYATLLAPSGINLDIVSGSTARTIFSIQPSSVISSYQITVLSDRRLKANIKEIDISSLINKVNIYTFDYKNGAKNQIGVIAQEYEDSEYKEYILSTDKDGYHAVNYEAFNLALIQKVQNLEKEIKEMKEVIKKWQMSKAK